jgi:hypothetical protein
MIPGCDRQSPALLNVPGTGLRGIIASPESNASSQFAISLRLLLYAMRHQKSIANHGDGRNRNA